MKKFNVLFALIVIAISIVLLIVIDLQNQMRNTYFGTAETSTSIINLNFKAVINKILVKNGDYIHKGDTIFTYDQSDLEKDLNEYENQIEFIKANNVLKLTELNKQTENISLQFRQDSTRIAQKIELTQLDIQNETILRKKMGFENTTTPFLQQKKIEIKQLETEFKNLRLKNKIQKNQLQHQISRMNDLEKSEIDQQKKMIQFYTKHQNTSALIAQNNGFIENLRITAHEAIEPLQELGKISTNKPNFVVGFIPENMNKTSVIHQKIYLKSVARPHIHANGTIRTIGNKIIELPLRLRKFPEIKAYGKEIFIEIPSNNQFYINEKLLISATPIN